MKSSVTKAFRKRLDRLPVTVQEQANKAYELWREDPYHNSLQFKRVSQRQPVYSARVSSTIEFWGCWSRTITFIGFGLGHTTSTMSY